MSADHIEIAVLGRLLETGSAREGVRNSSLIARLETARWIVPTTGRNVWSLREDSRAAALARLASLLPSWESDFALLRRLGRSPFDANDVDALPMLRRQVVVTLPMMHRRNWYAAVGIGPKHRPKRTPPCILTKDWVLRFRPSRGLVGIVQGSPSIDFYAARRGGEYPLPERAWVEIERIEGVSPKAAFTCENLGAFVDLPVEDSILVIFAPGADTEPATALLRMLPAVPWFHFPDLDGRGVSIGQQIGRALGRACEPFIPSFAEDYVDASRVQHEAWTDESPDRFLRTLAAGRRRIFQEVLMTDPRLRDAIVNFLRSRGIE
jgi:hypothetical protein